jgi:hypothetical protein
MTDMAKGQRRGNRETKKLKKEKAGSAPASLCAAWLTVERLEAREKLGRGKK